MRLLQQNHIIAAKTNAPTAHPLIKAILVVGAIEVAVFSLAAETSEAEEEVWVLGLEV